MKIIRWEALDRLAWDRLVAGSPEAWLFHRSAWIAIEARFFARENHAFAVQDERGELAAICPLYLRTLNRCAWVERVVDSGYHRHAGPAFRAALEPSKRKGASKLLMRHLLETARGLDADRIHLNAPNLAPANAGRAAEVPFWVQDHGFQLGLHVGPDGDLAIPGMTTLAADQIVDLTESEETLFRRLDEDFRNACRKAQKSGLTVAPDVANPIDAYYALAEVSARRTGESLAPRDYYQAIADAFGPSGTAVVHLARHEGRDAGAVLMLLDKEGAHYFAGVAHHDYLPFRVNNLLQWEAMRWAKARGIRQYRLGPVFPELPASWPVSRVSRFKGDLGGTSRTVIQGSLFLKPDRYRDDALKAIRLRYEVAAAKQSA